MSGKCDSKRTANFTSQEVCILLEVIKQYKHIIECKQSDKILWNRKAETWSKIADVFNAKSGAVYRDSNVLKKKYENMKKITKKKYADEKCAIRGTGGGPSKASLITPIDEELKELIGVQIDGLVSVYDCDNENIVQNSSDIAIAGCSYNGKDRPSCFSGPSDNAVEECSNSGKESSLSGPSDNAVAECSNSGKESNLSGTPSNDWSKYVPAMLRQPISQQLRFVVDDDDNEDENDLYAPPTTCDLMTSPQDKKTNRKTASKKNTGKVKSSTARFIATEKWDRLAEAKLELVKLQAGNLQKEHELKIKHMNEEHNLVKEKLKLEIELLKKQM